MATPRRRRLGAMLLNGLGVPQDQAKVMEWFRKAADEGYANRRTISGVCMTGAMVCRRILPRP